MNIGSINKTTSNEKKQSVFRICTFIIVDPGKILPVEKDWNPVNGYDRNLVTRLMAH